MRLILLIIIGLIAQVKLQAAEASLRITLRDSGFFVCEIRGKQYNEPQQELMVHRLKPGLCNIKIEKLQKNRQGSTIKIQVFDGDVFLEDGYAHHFVLNEENSMSLFDKFEIRNSQSQRSNAPQYRTKPHISDARFAEEMNLLRVIGPERRRYNAAMNMIATGMLTSAQISRMLNLFERPRLKMRLLEFGRIYVSDPGNYQKVVDDFYLRD
jgi:hypothetical protein